ncbi:MAG TPA: 1,2-phenylacetyl-CoA epoxidase subunit PaaD [Gemmatimonadaceae bacterium]|nr:1,2-phenylacetyl-CoA epoxidase subunit PaaD [Gemmatimonadaceae bacterium]
MDVLRDVLDPEVPALSIVDLGIVRDVEIDGDHVTVVITPTYSGCPAMKVIEDDIRSALSARGYDDVSTRTVYAPAWTSDWLSDDARERLRAYGIAPPGRASAATTELVPLTRRAVPVTCPFCGSTNTRHTSEFGSTSCKALHVCSDCTQPFEEFKAI